MAALNTPLFRYAATSAWPRNFGLRLVVYLLFSIAAWLVPPWGAGLTLVAIVVLGKKIAWLSWLGGLGLLWIFVAAPMAAELAGSLAETGHFSLVGLFVAGQRSLTFLTLLAASQWLTQCTTMFEIRSALGKFFGIFGQQAADTLSLVAALALGFLPWVMEQVQTIREAALVRGLPAGKPILTLQALMLPLGVRLVQKAHQTADSLELRGH